jgi:hypothetical protein
MINDELNKLKLQAKDLEHLLLTNTNNDENVNTIIRQYVVELYHSYKTEPVTMFKQYINAIEVQLELLQIPYKSLLKEYYKGGE